MQFVPFTKKIEVDAGYKSFYKTEDSRVTVFVIDTGIKLIFDKTQYSETSPRALGTLEEYFKPLFGVSLGLQLAKKLGAITPLEALDKGFVLIGAVEID